MVATNRNGNFLVQFSKNPFPVATAQVANRDWQIEFGAGERLWRGHGEPPAHFVWFQLPRSLAGAGVVRGWKFERRDTDAWRLENSRTGETLEGELFP